MIKTGYRATQKIGCDHHGAVGAYLCDCSCHRPGIAMMHFMPCCEKLESAVRSAELERFPELAAEARREAEERHRAWTLDSMAELATKLRKLGEFDKADFYEQAAHFVRNGYEPMKFRGLTPPI